MLEIGTTVYSHTKFLLLQHYLLRLSTVDQNESAHKSNSEGFYPALKPIVKLFDFLVMNICITLSEIKQIIIISALSFSLSYMPNS